MNTDKPIHDVGRKYRLHILLSILTLVIGAVLMVYMIFVESEPGALPLLLVVSGTAWYLITRFRIRSHHK